MDVLLGSDTLASFPNTDQGLTGFTYFRTAPYVALHTGTVTHVALAVFDWADHDGAQCRVGLYDPARNREASATVSGTPGAFITVALDTPVDVVEGEEYPGAVMTTFGTMYPYTSGTYQTSVVSNSGYPTLPATLGAGTEVATGSIGLAFLGTIASAQAIANVNGDDVVDAGSLANVADVTGFTETLTEGDIDGLELAVTDNEDGTVDFDVPDPIHGEVYPAVSYFDEDIDDIVDVLQDLTLSGATETATRSITFNPLTQYSVVLCRDPELEDPTFLGPNLEDVPVDGADLFWYVTADGELTGRGRITTDSPKTTIYGHWIESTGIMKIYSFVINEAGIKDKYPIIALPITAEAIMMLALSAETI